MGRVRHNNGNGNLDAFFDQVKDIEEIIKNIQDNVVEIEAIHSRNLSNSTTQQAQENHRRLERITDKTSALMQDARKRIKAMDAQNRKMPPSSDLQIRKQRQAALAKKLVDSATDFQNVQVKYKGKYKQRMEREYRIVKPNATQQEIEAAVENPRGPIFAQEVISSQVGSARRALEEVQDRHEEIKKIERSIEELFQLFQDMQVLLDTQQDVISTIDTHVEQATAYVEQGSQQMSKAIIHRRNARRRSMYICLCCILILVILAIVLYFQRCAWLGVNCASSSSSSTTPSKTT